jgi:hypothetical protein
MMRRGLRVIFMWRSVMCDDDHFVLHDGSVPMPDLEVLTWPEFGMAGRELAQQARSTVSGRRSSCASHVADSSPPERLVTRWTSRTFT